MDFLHPAPTTGGAGRLGEIGHDRSPGFFERRPIEVGGCDQGLRPEYSFGVLVRGAFPFFVTLLLVMALVTAFPDLVTYLPRLVYH
ncbi:MAG: hypothetical protein KJZ87_27815 [Thermoguttaceae bacterium]|nr:hypothetical protein [Thermoguttaceae bacterium]